MKYWANEEILCITGLAHHIHCGPRHTAHLLQRSIQSGLNGQDEGAEAGSNQPLELLLFLPHVHLHMARQAYNKQPLILN